MCSKHRQHNAAYIGYLCSAVGQMHLVNWSNVLHVWPNAQIAQLYGTQAPLH